MIKRSLLTLTLILPACGGSGGGSTPSPVSTPPPGPTNLAGRSVETDAVVGTSAVSGSEVTLTAAGFFTLQTSLSLHSTGVAYLRPIDADMNAAAVAPFVFWNGDRSAGWPASTTAVTYVPEASVSGDATAVGAMDAFIARLNSFGAANVNGLPVTFSRATSGTGAVCQVRVDPTDADIVANSLPGWTRWTVSGGVISTCVIVFRTIDDARKPNLMAHEMIHGLGLGHTVSAVSGTTLMNPTITDDPSLLDSLSRLVSTNILMTMRRRPNTLLTGSTEDERSASAASTGFQQLGMQ